MQTNKLITLIIKDFRLEWRNKFALGGIMLYLVSTVFVTYLAFGGVITMQAWNALFWLIMLFAAINANLKAFVQENESRQLYYYTLASAREVIGAKIAYNALLMTVLGLAGWLIFVAFMGNPVKDLLVFLLNMWLGVVGFACILTLISAIAAKAKNNFTLMAVLGFPLVLPLLLLVIRVSDAAVAGTPASIVAPDVLLTVLLISMAVLLSMLLFPYIWRE